MKKKSILKSTASTRKKIQFQRFQLWAAAALVAFAYLLISHADALTFVGIPVAIAILLYKELWRQTTKAIGPRGKYIPEVVATVAVIALVWGFGLAEPAGAVFYQKAQNFFCTGLTSTDSEAAAVKQGVSVTFNALRAFFLIYIAVSLIRVVNAVREDEDWQTLARTPILATMIVTVGDLLTSFFIPAGAGDDLNACNTDGGGTT